MDTATAKRRALEAIDRRAEELLAVSHQIHAYPELCFEEYHAHKLLTDAAERAGLPVTRGAYGLPTAFEARAGSEGPEVAVLCEYDALPGLGHACGHNVIAAAGLGAAAACAALAPQLGGRLRLLGTPAEEGGGGKVYMLERGAFSALDAAVMIHPAGAELVTMQTLANHQVVARYRGVAAHAAANPWAGVNALDAAVLGYQNVAALRQHIRADERVHGVFTQGGDKPNIVPDHAETHWYVRAGTRERLEALKPRVVACLQAGAQAAGCALHHEWLYPPYDHLEDDPELLAIYVENAKQLGRDPHEPSPDEEVIGSTDMGNVSQVVPSIHPMVQAAPPDVSIHTEPFAHHARGALGDRAVIDGAKILALTVIDRWAARTSQGQ